jgi:hypothetical protein
MQVVFSLEPANAVSSIVTTTCCAVHTVYTYLFWTLQIIYGFSLVVGSRECDKSRVATEKIRIG